MSPSSIILLALGMSVDAMIASIGRGAAHARPSLPDALKAGAIFGLVEALTPLIGWGIGILASQYVQAIDHWIAFGLLLAVGGRMILDAAKRKPGEERAARRRSLRLLLITAVGTSLDAMAVGVSLAVLDVNIIVVAAAIGATTTLMATGGMLAGRYLGTCFGRVAEFGGGVLLIGLGASFLLSHTAG